MFKLLNSLKTGSITPLKLRNCMQIRKMSATEQKSGNAAKESLLSDSNPKKTSSKKEAVQFTLKTPKGTKDWADKDMVIREAIFSTLASIFKSHGGVTIDTPVFELREILSGKYGEDSKLIYNLEDQGGELTSLRYDLTVPFARYVAMNNIQSMKRYHIAKVYRRDQPAMTKGRMREFYQCDFDIAGVYDRMVPDAEALSILVEGLTTLGINDFKVKVNNRKILDGIFRVCGVKDEDVRRVSSAVDKLDKSPWEVVKKEMTHEKNQPEEVADRIGTYVQHSGSLSDIIAILSSDEALSSDPAAVEGIEDMRILSQYTDAFGISEFLSFDLSLARGLDYYTGLIYEAVTSASAPPPDAAKRKAAAGKSETEDDASDYVGVGSIAAGGRYDGLVGMFLGPGKKGKPAPSVPCVGVSFGVERLFSIIKARPGLLDKVRPSSTQVYVMAFGGGKEWTGFMPERMTVVKQLWKAGIDAEFLYKTKANPRKQFEAAEKAACPLAVILGQEEFGQGVVKVKRLGLEEASDEGQDVKLEDLVPYVKKTLAEINSESFDHKVSEVVKLFRGL